jgi:hypothetical protein
MKHKLHVLHPFTHRQKDLNNVLKVLAIHLNGRTFTFALELVVLIERPFIDILSILSVPPELSSFSDTINICALEFIIVSSFIGFTMEFAALKTSLVGHFLRLIFTVFTVSLVFMKFSLKEGSVRENERSFSMGFSMIKPAQVKSSIIFVHPTITVGSGTILDNSKNT